jgi:hypothetical protein
MHLLPVHAWQLTYVTDEFCSELRAVLLLMSACKLVGSSQSVAHRLIIAQARVDVCKHVFRNKVDGLTALKYR